MSVAPRVYVDTSAFGALLVWQAESEALVEWLDEADVDLVSSDLLELELRRMAVGEGRDQAKVSAILGGVSLASLDRAVYRSAGFPPMANLRTLDALHLEAAIRLDVDAVLNYDHRLAEAEVAVGLDVVAPGASVEIRPEVPADVDGLAAVMAVRGGTLVEHRDRALRLIEGLNGESLLDSCAVSSTLQHVARALR